MSLALDKSLGRNAAAARFSSRGMFRLAEACPRGSRLRWNTSVFTGALVLATMLFAAGCATPKRTHQPRAFEFGRDTFAYTNELQSDYFFSDEGKWTSRPRKPAPDYTLHCFPMVRACREFFLNARFDPGQPKPEPKELGRLVRRVMAQNSRASLPPNRRIVIPGYADLHSFSLENEKLLKEECGTAVSSYFQRGHWRMVFPFSAKHRERTAAQLLKGLEANWPPIVHISLFPELTINHAMLIFNATETPDTITFSAYDPNRPTQPETLTYDRNRNIYYLPANRYFPGGEVDVYEVFCRWNY
jgi:hypothetical protein